MTKEEALAIVEDACIQGEPGRPSSELAKCHLRVAHEVVRVLAAAGAFTAPVPISAARRQELIDIADNPRTHDDDPEYIERGIDALIAAGAFAEAPPAGLARDLATDIDAWNHGYGFAPECLVPLRDAGYIAYARHTGQGFWLVTPAGAAAGLK